MEFFKYSILAYLLLISTSSSALNLAATEQPIAQSLYDDRTCNDLYIQASALEPQTFKYKATLSNNTRAATYTMTVFSGGIYYLGYTGFQQLVERHNSQQAKLDIEQIRHRMAEKRCFER